MTTYGEKNCKPYADIAHGLRSSMQGGNSCLTGDCVLINPVPALRPSSLCAMSLLPLSSTLTLHLPFGKPYRRDCYAQETSFSSQQCFPKVLASQSRKISPEGTDVVAFATLGPPELFRQWTLVPLHQNILGETLS